MTPAFVSDGFLRSHVFGLFAAILLLAPVDAEAAVGSTAGRFQVTATGAAAYRIPIALPPGTRGVQPNLGLSYTSQSGSGILGAGWSLDGFSAIARCPRTVAQDGVAAPVNLDSNDR
jgi:hypothetical protein